MDFISVIPNLWYAYAQGYKPGHVGARKKIEQWQKKAHMSTVLNVNIYALSVHLIIPLLFNSIIGLFIYTYSIYIWNNRNYNNYKHFANMKGTIYGNRLPRGTQVKKGWGPLTYILKIQNIFVRYKSGVQCSHYYIVNIHKPCNFTREPAN